MISKSFVLVMAALVPQLLTAQSGPCRFAKEIAVAGDTGFDYISVDSAVHRLFVSHGTKIVVIDTATDKVVGEVADIVGAHGLTLGKDLGLGFTANGGEDTVGIVDLAALRTLQKVKAGKDPDTISWDV